MEFAASLFVQFVLEQNSLPTSALILFLLDFPGGTLGADKCHREDFGHLQLESMLLKQAVKIANELPT